MTNKEFYDRIKELEAQNIKLKANIKLLQIENASLKTDRSKLKFD